MYIRVQVHEFAIFKKFRFEVSSDNSIVILFGVPGSGKTYLMNLIALPLLVIEYEDSKGVEPSKALDTVLNYLFPRYKSIIRSDTEIFIEVGLNGKEIRFMLKGHEVPKLDVSPYKGLDRYLRERDHRPCFVYLDEYRVKRLHMLLRGEQLEDDVLAYHLSNWLSYIKRIQKENSLEAELFDACCRELLRMLNYVSLRPLDLVNNLTEFNIPLMYESYTVLNLLTISIACLALCTDKPSIVLIDIPEHGLVPNLFSEVANVLTKHLSKSIPKMLILATHNPLLAALILRRVEEAKHQDRIRMYEMVVEYKDRSKCTKLRELELGKAPQYLIDAVKRLIHEVTK